MSVENRGGGAYSKRGCFGCAVEGGTEQHGSMLMTPSAEIFFKPCSLAACTLEGMAKVPPKAQQTWMPHYASAKKRCKDFLQVHNMSFAACLP